jgi:uncharacterized membrane protein/transglutaminase-like putative cysteine protease/sugar lactone lactonase YvrE
MRFSSPKHWFRSPLDASLQSRAIGFRPRVEPLEERVLLDASLPPSLVVGRTLSSYFVGGVQNNQETITYTVYNEQADPLTGVLLTDTLQPGVTFQGASQLPDRSGQNLAWSLGTIGGFDRASVTLTVNLASPTPLQLDAGARAFAMLDGASVSSSTPAAALRPGNVSDPGLLASTPDANTTDPFVQEVAAKLNYDPQQVFNFLHNDIGYNSYLGSVRGARGTLWSRAGNALDVASLGVALMRASGIPAQYEQGTLSKVQAQQLILSMFPATYQTVGYIPAGTQTADPANDPQLLSETEQHFWFQFDATGNGTSMKDADPLMTGTSGQAVTASAGSFGVVPDNLREKTEIKLVAETESEFDEVLGAGLNNQVVLDHIFNDVDLVGHPLSIGNAVSTSAVGLGITQIVYTYSPYLAVGDEANADPSSDPVINGMQYQEVYSNEPLVSVALTGLFLNVTLSGPQGPAETFQHTMFDRLGFAARQNPNNVNISFDTSTPPVFTPFDVTTVNVLPGLQSPNVSAPQADQLSRLASQLDQLSTAGTITDTAQTGPVLVGYATGLTRALGEQTLAESDTLDTALAPFYEVVAYADRPQVVATSEQLTQSGIATSIDFVSNAIRAIAFPGQVSDTTFNFNVGRGAMTTLVEDTVNSSINPGQPSASAETIFEAAQRQGIPLAKLDGSGAIAQLDSFGLGADATARMTNALQAGQTVIVPSAPVTIGTQQTTAWYQIDNNTGVIIDVFPDGGHEQAAPTFAEEEVADTETAALQRGALPKVNIATAKNLALDFKNSLNFQVKILNTMQEQLGLQATRLSELMAQYGSHQETLRAIVRIIDAITFKYLAGGADPPVSPELSDAQRVPSLTHNNVSSNSLSLTAGLLAGSASGSANVPNAAAAGQLAATWSSSSTSSFEVVSLTGAGGTVTGANGQTLGTGSVGLSLAAAVAASVAGSNQYSVNGIGSLSFYGPAESNLGVSGNWTSYTATVTGNGVSITLTTDGLTLNGQPLPAGTYTITTTSATLTGSGNTTTPNFAGSASLNVTGGTVRLGPDNGSITLGRKPFNLSSGATLDGYAGRVTLTAGGHGTDSIALNGNAANVLTVSATPNTLTTDQNTPESFQANVNTSLADTYNLTAQAPPGWTVTIDNTGKITVTPAPGLQGGTFPVRVIVRSQTDPNLVAQTTVSVTVTPTTPGETLNVVPDPILTVPLANGADTPTAFQVQIHNNGPAPVTENLAFSNVSSGFTLQASATSLTIPAGQFGVVGVYLMPTGTQLPPAGSTGSFTVTATNAANPADVHPVTKQFTTPAIDALTINSNPPQVSTAPGNAAKATLALQNTGNADETVSLAASGPAAVTVGGLSQVTVPAGQTVNLPITLTPAAGTALNSTLATTITATFGPTANQQTATTAINVQVVSPQVVALAQAATAAGQDVNNSQLAQVLTDLQAAVAQLQATPTDSAAYSQVLGLVGNLDTLLLADPALVPFTIQLSPILTLLQGGIGNVGTVLGLFPNFFSSLAQTLAIEATEQFTIGVTPGVADLQAGHSHQFQVKLTNTGPDAETLTLSTSGVPNGLTAQLGQRQVSLAAGASTTVPLTVTQTADLSGVFDLQVTAAASVGSQTATVAVGTRAAAADVLGVSVAPQVVSLGDPVSVTAQIFNTANVDRTVRAQMQILDASGNVLSTLPAVPVSLVPGTGNITANLGQVPTTGLATGIYQLKVSLLAADGSPLPGRSSQTAFGVGQVIAASIAASTAFVPPGTSSVSTDISVNNRSGLGTTTFSLAGDWSDANNPNGPWSYNYDIDKPITVHQSDFNPPAGPHVPQPAWAFGSLNTAEGGPLGQIPAWLLGTQPPGNDVHFSDAPPGHVYVHSDDVFNGIDGGGGIANASWTSPIDGTITITGDTWQTSHALGRSNNWSLVFNNTVLAQGTVSDSDSFTSSHPAPLGIFTETVHKGDVVRFEAVRANPSGPGEFEGVDLTITASNAPPSGNPGPAPTDGLTLTPAGTAAGFTLSDLAHGFPFVNIFGGIGPTGMVFPDALGGQQLMVLEGTRGVQILPTDSDGQNAASLPVLGNLGGTGLGQVNGQLYFTDTTDGLVQHISTEGTVLENIASVPTPRGIVGDPVTGHLLVSGGDGIYDVDPVAHTASRLVSGLSNTDGITLSPDGSTVYVANASSQLLGFDTRSGAQVFAASIPSVDGAALGFGSLAGFIFANGTNGDVWEVPLNNPANPVLIASGGSRGDLVTVDPNDGSLLLTQTREIVRLRPPPSGSFAGVSVRVTDNLPASGYAVDPTSISPGPASTSASQVVWNAQAPAGTSHFRLTGTVSNMAPGEVRTISTGGTVTATFTTSASNTGTLFVTNTNGPGIDRVDPAAGQDTSLLNTGGFADSLVFDHQGDLVYTLPGANELGLFNPNTNTNQIVANLPEPVDLALDPSGTGVVIVCGDDTVRRVELTTGAVTTLASNIIEHPATSGGGIAYDDLGNLFVAQNSGSGDDLLQLDATTGAVLRTIPLHCAGEADGVTFDPGTGAFWVVDRPPAGAAGVDGLIEVSNYLNAPQLQEFSAPSGFVLSNFDGISSDGQGNIFVAEFGARLDKYTIATNTFTPVTQPHVVEPDDIAPLVGNGSLPLTETVTLPSLTVAAEHVISVTPPARTVDRNSTADYTVQLTNPLPTDQTYQLSLIGLTGFTTSLAASVPVPAGQTVDVPLQVNVPAGATAGTALFEVIAQTSGGAQDSVEGQLTVAQEVALPSLGVSVGIKPAQATAGQGTATHYTVAVTNVGDVTDTYTLAATGLPAGVTASFSPATITVAPGERSARTVILTLTPAVGTAAGSYPFRVTATSTTDASVRASAPATLGVVSRGVRVSLAPTSGRPGSSFQLKVTNTGSARDTFDLSLGGPAGLIAHLGLTKVTLNPGASTTVTVTTTAGTFALPVALPLVVVARSEANRAVADQATASVQVPATAGMTAGLSPAVRVIPVPGTSDFLVLVNNTGNGADTYKATITGTSGPVKAHLVGLNGRPASSVPTFLLPGLFTGALLLQTDLGAVGTGVVNVAIASLTNPQIKTTVKAQVTTPPRRLPPPPPPRRGRAFG